MALSIQDSRILLKRSTNASEAPSVAPSSDFTDGTWTSLDVYIGEQFANTIDEKLYLRFTNNIRQIAVADSPTTNRLTYWNASGHLGNIAAPTDGYYLKYTNASGYIWAAAGGAESQTWNDVLMLGNASDGTNPLISAGDAIEWNNSAASFKTYLTNDQATAANRTVYLPLFDGQLAYHATGVPLVSGRVTYATTNGALTDTSLFTFDGTKLGVGIATATATGHFKGSTSDSSAYALKVDNSSSSALLHVLNSAQVGIGTSTLGTRVLKIQGLSGGSCVLEQVATDNANELTHSFMPNGALSSSNLQFIVGKGYAVNEFQIRKYDGVTDYIAMALDNGGNWRMGSSDTSARLNIGSIGTEILRCNGSSNGIFVVKAGGGFSSVGTPIGNGGLSSGDWYKDTAANILANGDYILAIKA